MWDRNLTWTVKRSVRLDTERLSLSHSLSSFSNLSHSFSHSKNFYLTLSFIGLAFTASNFTASLSLSRFRSLTLNFAFSLSVCTPTLTHTHTHFLNNHLALWRRRFEQHLFYSDFVHPNHNAYTSSRHNYSSIYTCKVYVNDGIMHFYST